MASISNFGEQFSASVLGRTKSTSVTPAITNNRYEGEIKKPGDRVNILSFLNRILLSDYAVGTDMSSETIIDSEDQLIVEKRKYYNFSLDRLEDLFTYGGDIPGQLVSEASEELGKTVDAYVLDKVGSEAKAGNWIGMDLQVLASGTTGGTMASIVTTATGGTITLQSDGTTTDNANPSYVEGADGSLVYAGFSAEDLYKGVRLRSTAAFVTPWYRISAVTNSTTATVTEWDEAVSGSDFEEGFTLRGLFGGDGVSFPKYGAGEASFTTYNFCGYEFQAARATAVTASTIYDQITLLAQALDENDVPAIDRKLVVPPAGVTMLRQATELQPTGIAEIYTGTVIHGRTMRIGALDVHVATGARLSVRAGHPLSTGSTTINPADVLKVASGNGYIIPAVHTEFMTYADKWSESRVVDAENQFAKKYQGLFLFGAKVPKYRRKFGAVLFGSF